MQHQILRTTHENNNIQKSYRSMCGVAGVNNVSSNVKKITSFPFTSTTSNCNLFNYRARCLYVEKLHFLNVHD